MNSRHLISIPLATIAALAVAGVAEAHDGWATGTCQGGVQWAYEHYDKLVVNTITVTIDGVVRWQDLDFKSSDAGTIATDQTLPHTWDVRVDAPGTQFDRHPSGSYAACVVPSSTTVVVTTVPSSEPATTVVTDTTTVVAVDIPPVPTTAPATTVAEVTAPVVSLDVVALIPDNPVLPETGGMSSALIMVAIGFVIVGVFLVVRGRRVP